MTEVILISLVAIMLALIAVLALTRKKGMKIKINKTVFVIGLIIALLAALMMFCQERCFLGVDLEGWPTVLGIVGIGLIASSQFRPMKKRR